MPTPIQATSASATGQIQLRDRGSLVSGGPSAVGRSNGCVARPPKPLGGVRWSIPFATRPDCLSARCIAAAGGNEMRAPSTELGGRSRGSVVVVFNLSILDVDRGGACFHGTARAGQFLIGLAALRCDDSAFRATASEFAG
jgi:hypothetical protein